MKYKVIKMLLVNKLMTPNDSILSEKDFIKNNCDKFLNEYGFTDDYFEGLNGGLNDDLDLDFCLGVACTSIGKIVELDAFKTFLKQNKLTECADVIKRDIEFDIKPLIESAKRKIENAKRKEASQSDHSPINWGDFGKKASQNDDLIECGDFSSGPENYSETGLTTPETPKNPALKFEGRTKITENGFVSLLYGKHAQILIYAGPLKPNFAKENPKDDAQTQIGIVIQFFLSENEHLYFCENYIVLITTLLSFLQKEKVIVDFLTGKTLTGLQFKNGINPQDWDHILKDKFLNNFIDMLRVMNDERLEQGKEVLINPSIIKFSSSDIDKTYSFSITKTINKDIKEQSTEVYLSNINFSRKSNFTFLKDNTLTIKRKKSKRKRLKLNNLNFVGCTITYAVFEKLGIPDTQRINFDQENTFEIVIGNTTTRFKNVTFLSKPEPKTTKTTTDPKPVVEPGPKTIREKNEHESIFETPHGKSQQKLAVLNKSEAMDQYDLDDEEFDAALNKNRKKLPKASKGDEHPIDFIRAYELRDQISITSRSTKPSANIISSKDNPKNGKEEKESPSNNASFQRNNSDPTFFAQPRKAQTTKEKNKDKEEIEVNSTPLTTNRKGRKSGK